MRVISLLLLPLLISCGKKTPKHEPFPSPEIEQQLALYESDLPSVADAFGFLPSFKCDQTMFSSLAHPVEAFDVWKAFDASLGQWFRSPSHDCYPDSSSSDLSADSALGLMWYAYLHKDLRIAETLWSYASSHAWHLGRGKPDTSFLDDYLKATLAQLIHALGGSDHVERQLPILWTVDGLPTPTGFRAHLEVLHILLRERLYTSLEPSAFDALKLQYARQPSNALFAFAAGDTEKAAALLQSGGYWPATRLPTTADRCEGWLFQRDLGSDWQPCSPDAPLTGGDFVFLASLIVKGL